MGKKKRTNQNSNNPICQGDSSESESNKDSSQATEVSKVICSHINKSADLNVLRKNIRGSKDTYLFCSTCKKGNDSTMCKDGWVCLRCASYNCGPNEEDHRADHFRKPHSDPHYLAYHLSSNTIWCFRCEQEIPVDASKKVQSCIDMIKKQHNDNLLVKPIELDTDTRQMNGNVITSDYFKSDVSSYQSLQNSLQNRNTSPDLNLPRVKGLCNLGNTCFFNSVLQCLAQTPGLVPLLEEMEVRGEKFHLELDGITIDAELEKHKSSEVSEQLARVLTEVAGGGGDGDAKPMYGVVNPRSLLKALTNKCPQFEGGDQHDAHELLRHLLDSVYKEDLKRYQAAILNHIGYYDEAKKNLDDLDEEKKKFAKKSNQKVCDTILIRPDHLFKGSLVSILQCEECQHKSKREETFLDLSLPVAQEKAQPPVRKKPSGPIEQFCNTSVDEKKNTEESSVSNHQLGKKKSKRIYKIQNAHKKEDYKVKPTIEEEDKKDSVNGEQTDADVEDNEDITCEEQDPKTEIVESGYSSEKQMSARGSPVTTQDTEDHPIMNDMSLYGLPLDSGANRAESGLGSNQELTVAIPEENNPDCTSQESVRVNASNESPDISSDSQQGNFQNIDLSLEYQLPLGSDSTSFGRDRVLDWNCVGSMNEPNSHSSSASLSVSPGCSRDNINISRKGSPISGSQSNEMSICTSLPNSNDNMSICDSLPENISLLVNSPNKKEENNESQENWDVGSHHQENGVKECSPDEPTELESLKQGDGGTKEVEKIDLKYNANLNRVTNQCSPVEVSDSVSPREENSSPEELVNLSLENKENGVRQISRCSPVELGEFTELDSGLLKLSLEGMTSAGDTERRSSPVTTEEAVFNDQGQTGFVLVGGVMPEKSSIPLPPPSPPNALFTSPYKFTHPEPAVAKCEPAIPRYEPSVSRYDSTYQRHRIEEGEYSLQSCLNQFTTIEMLTGGNKVGCEACTERLNKGNKEGKTVYQHSSKQLLICKLPPIVIFHLKRFQVQRFSFRKISLHVNFPLVLDISPFCSKDEPERRDGPILYSLYGVVEHSGTMHGGHYVAYVKVRSFTNNKPGVPPPGKWYYISDSRVSTIEESEVLNKQAYLLFYEKIL